jgi:pilus assembly protein CpaE
MDIRTPVLAILASDDYRALADALAASLGYAQANVIVGTVAEAAQLLSAHTYTPRYVFIDIGSRSHDILTEIDLLAEHCDMETRVAVLGQTNDISFYRELMDRGVSEYYAHKVTLEELRGVMIQRQASKGAMGQVVVFIGASAGDGCTTLAINAAYALATEQRKSVVLVDFDYQFGMIARQLDLAPKYGIKEIFDHPERGIDETLVNRMTVRYRDIFDVVAAPQPLHFLPQVTPESVRDLITSLQQKYQYVILDLPHLWSSWTSSALSSAHHVVLIAQLWLKSVNHAARLLTAWQRIGIDEKHIITVVNRSGSKFKEAINARDFERVVGRRIDLYVPNDIKTIVKAENQAATVLELGNSLVASEVRRLAEEIAQPTTAQTTKPALGAVAS